MEYVVALFGFGALLLLIGIVGGDLTFQGATVPKVGRLPRFTVTVLGVVFIVTSGVLWVMVSLPRDTPAAAPSSPGTPASSSGVTKVRHELAPFHRSETLELFVDQSLVGTSTVTPDRRVNVLEVPLSPGEHRFDATLEAATPAGDEGTFVGEGILDVGEDTVFRVRINRSSAGVELVPGRS